MSRKVTVSPADARRFLRRANLIDSGARDVQSVLVHHGYVQIDPINVCGRMHDHILRNPVPGYAEGDLMGFLHGNDPGAPKAAGLRQSFEQHHPATHILAAFPLEAWRFMRSAMRERTKRRSAWMGGLTPREKAVTRAILRRLSERGPVAPEDFGEERSARRVWGTSTLARATLQKLFFHGQILIAARDNNRRLYDLPERVLPGKILGQGEPSPDETARWLALLSIRQHRLARMKRTALGLIGDLVTEVHVKDGPVLHCLTTDLGLFESAGELDSSVRLLAPLDPMIYDRRTTLALFGFDYTWEAYTPPGKRKRGYYALPVLSGTEIVGHVDLSAQRAERRLRVVSRNVRRGHASSGAVASLARFLGLRSR